MSNGTILAHGRYWSADQISRGEARAAPTTMRGDDDAVVMKVDMSQLVPAYAAQHRISHAEADARLRRTRRLASEGPPAIPPPREKSDTVNARATRLLARAISYQRGIPLAAAQVIAVRTRATATGHPLAEPPETCSPQRLQAKAIAATTGVSLGDAQRQVHGRAVEARRLMTSRIVLGAEDSAAPAVGDTEIRSAMVHATRVVGGAPKNMGSSVLVAMVAGHLVEGGMTRVRADAMAAIAVQRAILAAG